MSDLDTLLDNTLDDLADLPTFKPFAAGGHRVTITLKSKEINKKPCVEMLITMVEPIELADPSEEAPKEGDTANTLYFLDNEIGQGKFKEVASVFGEALGITTLRDIVEQVTDIECVIVSSVTVDKKDKDRCYMNVKQVEVV